MLNYDLGGIKEFTPEEIERIEVQFADINTDWIKCAQAALKIAKDVYLEKNFTRYILYN